MNDKMNDFANIEEILNKKKLQFAIKRLFDIIMSTFGLLITAPFLVLIAIAIKMDSTGPILFKQIRVGKNEKEFKILKFRTMIIDAEKKGMQITVGKDSRITKVGHFLRKVKLDELPQLLNVFIGEMSFVGPRPEVPKYVAMYTTQQKNVLRVSPGITDLASIEYRDENSILAKSDDPESIYINQIMQEKLKLNLEYIIKASFVFDIYLIFQTLFKIIR